MAAMTSLLLLCSKSARCPECERQRKYFSNLHGNFTYLLHLVLDIHPDNVEKKQNRFLAL